MTAHNFTRLLTKTARGSIAMLVALAVALFFVAVKFDELLRQNHDQHLRFQHTLDLVEAREEVEERIVEHFLALERLSTWIEANPDLNQDDFAAFVDTLRADSSDIINFAAAPGLVVRFISPYEENRGAIGLDYNRNLDQRPEVMAAIENNAATVVGPVDLVQGGRGIIIRQPVFVGAGTDQSPRTLWGIVSLVLDYDGFWQASGLADLATEYQLFVASDLDGDGVLKPIFGDPAVKADRPVELTFDFPTGTWQLMAVPAGGWPALPPNAATYRAIIALVGALIMAAAVTIAVLAIAQQTSRKRLIAAIDAMDDGFAMFDRNGYLVAHNQRYAEIYDLSAPQIRKGASFEEIIRLGARHGLQMDSVGRQEEWVRERLASFRGPDIEFEQELYGGRHYLASDRNVEGGDKVCVRTDVTQLKRAQEKAESASRAKSQFINTLSHELRTPLTVILGTAGLLKHLDRFEPSRRLKAEIAQHPIDPARAGEALTQLMDQLSGMMEKQERSARQMLTLVEDMLDIAQVESGSYSVFPERHPVSDILTDVRDQMGQLAQRKGLALDIEESAAEVYCDRLRTVQILLNLVGNAIKFTPSGSVRVSVQPFGDTVAFTVTDTGPGIPHDAHQRIFNAFEQVDSSDSRQHGGVGLGLAISRGLATAQGGTLELRCGSSQGSTFVLTLPRHSPQEMAGASSSADADAGPQLMAVPMLHRA